MYRELKEKFRETLNSGALMGLELFNINELYFEIEDRNLWIIDGGIQLRFPKGIVQIGWAADDELILAGDSDIKNYKGELVYKELTKGAIYKLHGLKGKLIEKFEWQWMPYEVWDDTASDFVERETLIELILHFNTKEKLQIATIDYELSADEDPMNFRFTIGNEILISFQNQIEIMS